MTPKLTKFKSLEIVTAFSSITSFHGMETLAQKYQWLSTNTHCFTSPSTPFSIESAHFDIWMTQDLPSLNINDLTLASAFGVVTINQVDSVNSPPTVNNANFICLRRLFSNPMRPQQQSRNFNLR